MNNYKGFFKVNENNGGVNVCTFSINKLDALKEQLSYCE